MKTQLGAGLMIALTLSGCNSQINSPPMGIKCLPNSVNWKECRNIKIVSNPYYPGDQTPQLTVQSFDPTFEKIVGRTPNLVPLATGFGFLEGPVYLKNKDGKGGSVFVTDQVHNSIYAIEWNGLQDGMITTKSWNKPKLFRNPSGVANGQTSDMTGNLLTAETTGRRVSITKDFKPNQESPEPQANTLIGSFKGKKLNSPNDLVVKSDGSVWFTDPSYGSLQFPPQPAQLPNNVYRYDPKTKQLKVIEGDLVMPNGIAFGPEEKTIYIIDSGAIQGPRTYFPYLPHRIYMYNLSQDGRSLKDKKLFANVSPGFPDGMRLDENGNIYVGTLEGIHVINPAGKLIGKFLMAKETANLSFGGTHNNILFIGSSNTLWAIKLNTKGLVPIRTRSIN